MSKIVRIETGRLDYPLVGEFKFFKAGARPSVLVRLTDDAGVQGWGQSVPVETWTYETVETVETTLRHYLAPAILGADPADLAGVHERMERAIRPSFSVGSRSARRRSISPATTCGAGRPAAAQRRSSAARGATK
jgi:L-alanine-DL-glutamate epimerase-like enolase superfamily enzyme